MVGNVTVETKVHSLPNLNNATDKSTAKWCKENRQISSFQNILFTVYVTIRPIFHLHYQYL
jgi:hypothetical protein